MKEAEARRAAMDGDWATVARYCVRKGYALPTPSSAVVQGVAIRQPRPNGSCLVDLSVWVSREQVEDFFQWAQSLQEPPRLVTL